ncbi:hypothetical protein K4A83_11185 [Spirulina subsalsa FACHB-351]|uniref:Uncharacterized protein n=1 Tax=Spirulina subsalsa FACHB-351 TaxID=234711 RepID=A0ABT3L5N3_9CYAN|nr:hypothetical protein [Spirulina subsalsa]MCW6036821.1 hypothetical protein [Spirulina subsalsa FACHB-351]
MSFRPLEQPSDLFDAIRAVLLERIRDIHVGNYDDFGADEAGRVGTGGEILIEFERTTPGERAPDGRYGYEYAITLHCVVGRHRHRAALEAVNLAAVVQRVATDALWGLPVDQIKRPEQLRAEPSFYKQGANGYDAWGVSFNQRITLGPNLAEEDPQVGTGPGALVSWAASDDEADYETPNP